MEKVEPPPHRVQSKRLVLRCYEPSDARALKDAVDSSLDHLRPFMNWAWDAPEAIEVVEERLMSFGELFESCEDFIYGLFISGESEIVGGAGLHPRVGPQALEIGYWIRASRVRQGLATEATAALTRLAFERCGVERVEIHVDPANTASIGVPVKLCYVREATLRERLPPIRDGGERRDETIFSLLDEEYPESPSAIAQVTY